MKPADTDGWSGEPTRGDPSKSPTRVAVAAGPLAGPVLSRVVGIGASRADLPIDRLDDALLLADVIAASAPALVPAGRIEMTAVSADGVLMLRLGPLRAGGAERLLSDRATGAGSIIERLATSVSVTGEGDHLTIEIAP